tara:strand:+ start:11284 stop:11946 length:663 start_codon:yes stop_codon:yes gene_type:complete
MTLDEIAYNILNLVRAGRSSNDDIISLDQIKFNIQHYRAMFIRRDYNRNGFVSNTLEQDLGCLDIIKVDASKCCNLPIDCPVYRTKRKLPRTVRFNFRDAFTFIGKPNGTGTIPRVEAYEIEYIPYDKYTSGQTKFYVIDDYIYVYNPKGLEAINVRGVFEDPETVAEFATCNDGECYDEHSPYPLPMDMVSLITNGIAAGELTLMGTGKNDTSNDRQQN